MALAVAPAAMAQQACQSAGAEPAEASQRDLANATLCLMNAERARRGMARLKLSTSLGTAAGRHARDMAVHNYFSHNSRSGASFVTRIRRAGYLRSARRWSVGENIAWGAGSRATPRSIMRSWMRSPGHRANLLARHYREVGIGIAPGAPVRSSFSSAATYATDFGVRG